MAMPAYYDFLLFDEESILSRGNRALFKRLKEKNAGAQGIHPADQYNGSAKHQRQNVIQNTEAGAQAEVVTFQEECELWEDWKTFPNFPSFTGTIVSEGPGLVYPEYNLTSGDCFNFMVWLVHTFARSVCCSGSTDQRYHKRLEDEGLDFITVDDLAFLFTQVQHNIGKWNLLHKAFTRGVIRESVEEKEYTEQEKKLVKIIEAKGYEYPNGSGVSGTDGRARYQGMTKLFYYTYFNKVRATGKYTDQVNNNRKALLDALMVLRNEEVKAMGPVESSSSKKPKKSKAKDAIIDPALHAINLEAWGTSIVPALDPASVGTPTSITEL